MSTLNLTSRAGEQTPLGQALKDIEVADHWIYDDLPAAIAQAKATGKPLLVVLRCVPCPPGKTLDLAVMQPNDETAALEKKFVCVRIIQTNGLDLAVFQYDYDMSWNAMFLNADLTIYGRYGSRTSSGAGSDGELTLPGFQKAAERALALHGAYPGNRGQLAAKTGPAPAFARPEKTPGLTDKPVPASTRQNCIHCHMVKEHALRAKWEQGELTEKDLYVFPMPDRIGLSMDLKDGVVVKSVMAGSPAAAAGIEAGDELLTLAGQPLVSTADIQWVLNAAPSEGSLVATLRRNGQSQTKTLQLAGDWKKYDIGWRASSWYGLRYGVKFEPLTAEQKRDRGLAEGSLALLIKGMFGRGGPILQQAGVRQNDVIVGIDGNTAAMSESEFLVHLRTKYRPQDKLQLAVLRGGERKELTVPVW
ncbi:MAG: Trx7/PDZ domain-containing (seleno)protein [Pirellulaceae bacterium]|nr:Trx7/PDZ domain-containing (seleno)protein [Pirellulaceae bacterium]